MEADQILRGIEARPERKTAIIVGVLFIIATVAPLLSLVFYGPITDAPDDLANVSANENQVKIVAVLQLIGATAIIGIPIMMFPILKKHNESLALGYVGARIIEGFVFVVGVIGLLSLLTLSQEFVKAGAPDASHFQTLGVLLLAEINWGFAVPGVIAFSIGGLMFYYVLYQSKLVPRWISVWGIIGAALILAIPFLSSLFGLIPETFVELLAPIGAVNETENIFLAVWLILKGFKSPAIAPESAEIDTNKV